MYLPLHAVVTPLLLCGTALAAVLEPQSTVDGSCKGANGAPGVCIATSKCTASGGKYITDACPGTPDDIKCCTKTTCGDGGNCRWISQCSSGKIQSNLCPGPDDFKCCLPGGGDDDSGNLGQKILAKAKTAEGIPCRY